MAQHDSRLRTVVDLDELRRQLANSFTDCSIYPDAMLTETNHQSI